MSSEPSVGCDSPVTNRRISAAFNDARKLVDDDQENGSTPLPPESTSPSSVTYRNKISRTFAKRSPKKSEISTFMFTSPFFSCKSVSPAHAYLTFK